MRLDFEIETTGVLSCSLTKELAMDESVSLSSLIYSYRDLLDEFTHIDGTPAGVEE